MEKELKIYQQYLIKQQFSPRTTNEMLRSVKQFMNWMSKEGLSIDQCRYNDIMAYVQSLQAKGVKAAYINNCIKDTRWYFKYLVGKGAINSNPVREIHIKGVQRSKVLHCYSEEELEKLYVDFSNDVKYDKDEVKLRDTVMLGMLIFQGFQPAELKILLVTDIDLQKGMIHIPETPRSKERLLSLNAKQVLPIIKYLDAIRSEKMFISGISNTLAFMFRKIEDQLALDIKCQDIRTSRVMLWVKQENIRKAQYLSGMKYISSLKKYQEQLTDKLREKINQYHPLEM